MLDNAVFSHFYKIFHLEIVYSTFKYRYLASISPFCTPITLDFTYLNSIFLYYHLFYLNCSFFGHPQAISYQFCISYKYQLSSGLRPFSHIVVHYISQFRAGYRAGWALLTHFLWVDCIGLAVPTAPFNVSSRAGEPIEARFLNGCLNSDQRSCAAFISSLAGTNNPLLITINYNIRFAPLRQGVGLRPDSSGGSPLRGSGQTAFGLTPTTPFSRGRLNGAVVTLSLRSIVPPLIIKVAKPRGGRRAEPSTDRQPAKGRLKRPVSPEGSLNAG